jgi:hypothetical protein
MSWHCKYFCLRYRDGPAIRIRYLPFLAANHHYRDQKYLDQILTHLNEVEFSAA